MTNYQFRITQVNSITGLNGPDMRLAILKSINLPKIAKYVICQKLQKMFACYDF